MSAEADFLTCRNVVKRFGATTAVDDVDLTVSSGDVMALLGPSGCGKTTLLRMIAGFEIPDSGQIVLDGRTLTSPSTFLPPERRRVAMVFQDFALFPHMNVAANVAFGLRKGADKRRRVGELLDLVGLAGLGERLPHQLSGGQQQRVALARALASEPDLVLLDEPFSNLDPSIRARVRGEVKQLIRQVGITAVFVTHDQEEALSLAEQVAVMISGRILQVGSPAQVYAQPVSRDVGEFVGDANFMPAIGHGDTADCELGSIRVSQPRSGAVEVMVRAENLELVRLDIADGLGVPGEVLSVEYYGHDQMAVVRLASQRLLRVRLAPEAGFSAGQKVGVIARGEALVFAAGSGDGNQT